MKTRIILVRHAECLGNVENKLSGRTDFELTSNGIIQAGKLAKCMKNKYIDVVYASPLQRARTTAKYIARECNIEKVKIEEDLIEIHYGVCDGMCWTDINNKYPDVHKLWKEEWHYPTGIPEQEDCIDLQSRMIKIIQKIINENKGKTICIVSHGIAIASYMCWIHKIKLEKINELNEQSNTAYTELEEEDGQYTIICEGDNTHLKNY